jgi:hypothetical protein
VIGIQSGPPGRGVHSGFHGGHGGQDGDAGGGDDRKDQARVFRSEEADQCDLLGVSGVAEGRAQGDPVGGDKSAREQLTLIRIFEELRELGYEGSYDAVRRFAKRWRAEHRAATTEANVPLSFAPGEVYQFDWSHEVVLINGVTVTVKVAHVRLCHHGRMPFVRAYPRETQEMVFDAHNRAFAFFKGTCTRGIYDNMKTAVETVLLGKGGSRAPITSC